MWDAVPENLRVLVALAVMAFFSLFVAGLISKYESYMAEKQLVVQRLLRGINQIEGAFNLIPTGSIPQGMGKKFRQEVFARYIAIKQIIATHPGVNQSISQAELRVSQEPAGLSDSTPPQISDKQQLDGYLKGLSAFKEILHNGDLCGKIELNVRGEYVAAIQLLEAEAAYNFFTQQADRLADAGQFGKALSEIRILDGFLQHITVMSNRLMELKRGTKKRFLDYYERQIATRAN